MQNTSETKLELSTIQNTIKEKEEENSSKKIRLYEFDDIIIYL